MSDTFPKQRDLLGNLDTRSREGNKGAEASDPLAELARLVGRDDPFKDLFTARETRNPARTDRIEPPPMLPTPEPFDRFSPAAEARAPGSQPFGRGDLPGQHGEPQNGLDDRDFHAPLGQGRPESFRLPARMDQQPGHGGYDDPSHDGSLDETPPLNADLWAQGMPEPVSTDPLHYAPAMDEPETAMGGSRKRTFVVLAAVLALTAGGLGATFLVRGGSSATASGEPPTILADTEPTKVQPPDTSNQATGGDGNTALIEKSASDNVNSAKVVNTQERPVDLSQLPKAPDPVPAPNDGRVAVTTTSGGEAAANAFPEPRKVKTVMVRPDGSVVGADQSQAADPAAPADAVPKPATPKSTTRAPTTPRVSATPTDAAPVKPKPAAHPAPKPKQTADATPAPDAAVDAQAAAPAAGGFAVQLAAPPTEQEAKDISARLQKKFASELDGHTPMVRKADNKSVYRVRVGSLSQDDAKALCAKLQAGGGSCFVVHN